MNDKPTYKEYSHDKIGNVVRTQDGRFFYNNNYKVIRWLGKGISFVLLIIYLVIHANFYYKGSLPPSAWFTFCMMLVLLNLPAARLLYRLARYEEIPEGSEDYVAASEGFAKKDTKSRRVARIIAAIVVDLIFLCFVLNSYPAFYIRRVIENHPVVMQGEPYHDGGGVTIIPLGGNTDLVVVPENESPALKVTVSGWLLKAQASIDDKPMTKGFHWWTRGGLIWEADYCTSECFIFVDRTDIQDGSVLEMTCGDMHRKWVFDLDEG